MLLCETSIIPFNLSSIFATVELVHCEDTYLKMTRSNNDLADQASIEYCKPSFEVNKLARQIGDTKYAFQILKSEGSLLIWIGAESDDKFVDLSLAFPTNYSQTPVVTSILGNSVSLVSSNFAMRISQLLKKPVHISCNVTADRLVLPLLEKNLIELIKINPDVF